MVELDLSILRHAPQWQLEDFAKANPEGLLTSFDPIRPLRGEDTPSDMIYWINDVDDGVIFTFNDAKYLAIIDPQDGYRSSLDALFELPPNFQVKNKFPHILVNVDYVDSIWSVIGGTECCSMLFFRAEDKNVIEIGTINTDDYYPSGIIRFTPPFQASLNL